MIQLDPTPPVVMSVWRENQAPINSMALTECTCSRCLRNCFASSFGLEAAKNKHPNIAFVCFQCIDERDFNKPTADETRIAQLERENEALRSGLRTSVELNRKAADVIEKQAHGRLVLSIPAAASLVERLRGGGA